MCRVIPKSSPNYGVFYLPIGINKISFRTGVCCVIAIQLTLAIMGSKSLTRPIFLVELTYQLEFFCSPTWE